MTQAELTVRGVRIFRGLLTDQEQSALLTDLRKIVASAPLFSPQTPSGKPMSVQMTSAGKYGWISDRSGYRYSPRHPNGSPWPAIPGRVLALWSDLVSDVRMPDCCLINFYTESARMGLHQDRDEADFSWPVLSVSLGDDALFRIGNLQRGGKTTSLWLHSGDIAVIGGSARLIHHGVDRIRYQSSRLLPRGGRINLTLRVTD